MKKYFFIVSLFFIACQDEKTLELPNIKEKIVVEGAIEPGFPPYVILTKNQGYFDPIDINTYNDLFITDANVIVWNYNENGTKDSVILKQLPPPFDSIPIYTDTNLISNPNNLMLGKSGMTYYLEIKWKNEVITSSTTIPEPTPMDCLWVEKNELVEKEFKYDIRAIFSDNANIQNNVLIRSKRLEHWKKDTNCIVTMNHDPKLLLVDVGPDVLINGETFEVYFPRPKDDGGVSFNTYNSDHYRECYGSNSNDSVLIPKDVVLIKFCQINEPSMRFWRGLFRQFGTNGNPFSEPMNLVSNINNGLGIWTGYGAVYYKVPIVKDTVIYQQYVPEIIDIF